MKFDTTVLIILGFTIECGEGYVSGVNPKLVRTEYTTRHQEVDYKMNQQHLVESPSHQFSTTPSYYDKSQIMFPSPSYSMSYSQEEAPEQIRDGAETRTFRVSPVINNHTSSQVQLSRLSLPYPFERDDDDDRPIWTS